MDVLIRFVFSIEEIKNMMDTNFEIDNIDDEILKKLIDILKMNKCSNDEVRNILISNPFYLSRNCTAVMGLIDEMKKFGLVSLNTIFDSNPFILNLEDSDFLELIRNKKSEGLNDLEIKDFICYDLV